MKALFAMIQEIADDNGLRVKEDWEELGRQAGLLTKEEADILCTGEVSEAEAIVEQYNISYLHDILNEIFDGDLHDMFYE